MSKAIAGEKNSTFRGWKPYPHYKITDIKWLKNPPEHWELRRAKFIFKKMERPVRPEDDVITAFRDGTVTLRTNRRTEGFTFSFKEIGYQGLRKGDLVIHAMDGFAGAIGIADSDGKATPVYSVLRPRGPIKVGLRYYSYLLRFLALNGYIISLAKGIRERSTEFRYKEVKELWLPLFPFVEQERIASFLDRETAKIDALIAKKEQMIELLQEKRTAFISHVVTKGLDPSVPMKDSGVEWLGEIPANWEVYATKRVALRIQTGCTPPTSEIGYYEDGSIPWFGPGSFGVELELEEPVRLISSSALEAGVARLFSAGSTMIVTIGATIGKVGYIKSEASSNQQITAVTFDASKLLDKFAAYQLKRLEPVLRGIAASTTLPIMDQQEVGYLPLALPPKVEQKTIVRFIDMETQKIDVLVAKIEEAIEKLKEYRTALISSAVTGKIDVLEEAA